MAAFAPRLFWIGPLRAELTRHAMAPDSARNNVHTRVCCDLWRIRRCLISGRISKHSIRPRVLRVSVETSRQIRQRHCHKHGELRIQRTAGFRCSLPDRSLQTARHTSACRATARSAVYVLDLPPTAVTDNFGVNSRDTKTPRL